MTSTRLILFFALMLAVVCACAQPAPETVQGPTKAEDEAALRAALDEWYETFNARDAARLASLYTNDGIAIPDGQPERVGRAAIQKGFEDSFPDENCRISGEMLEVEVYGDVAYERGIDRMTCTSAESGETTEASSRWIAICKRGPDGAWLVYRDIGNSSLPRESE